MGELLIPFGVDKVTGEVVEPEDAPKGRACNCLCPGCKAPLLSRHPKEKRYHFAHDSRHKDAKPEEECPFNSAVAVAMMVRELADRLAGENLETPALEVMKRYDCCGGHDYVPVSRGAINTVDDAHANAKVLGHQVDVLLQVRGCPILVDLVYKGKLPIELDQGMLQDNKAALMELNCDSFSISSLKGDRSLRFSEAVLAFVLREGVRKWVFHPKTKSRLHQAGQNHRCFKHEPRRLAPERSGSQTSVVGHGCRPAIEATKAPVRYQCVICNVDWVHDFRHDLCCPKCQRHLFARPIG